MGDFNKEIREANAEINKRNGVIESAVDEKNYTSNKKKSIPFTEKGSENHPAKVKVLILSSGLDLYFRSYKIVLFKDWRNLYLSSCTLCGAGMLYLHKTFYRHMRKL